MKHSHISPHSLLQIYGLFFFFTNCYCMHRKEGREGEMQKREIGRKNKDSFKNHKKNVTVYLRNNCSTWNCVYTYTCTYTPLTCTVLINSSHLGWRCSLQEPNSTQQAQEQTWDTLFNLFSSYGCCLWLAPEVEVMSLLPKTPCTSDTRPWGPKLELT